MRFQTSCSSVLSKPESRRLSDVCKRIIIDLTKAHHKIVLKFRQAGDEVEVLGFNEAGADMIDRFALHDKDERLAASASLH